MEENKKDEALFPNSTEEKNDTTEEKEVVEIIESNDKEKKEQEKILEKNKKEQEKKLKKENRKENNKAKRKNAAKKTVETYSTYKFIVKILAAALLIVFAIVL